MVIALCMTVFMGSCVAVLIIVGCCACFEDRLGRSCAACLRFTIMARDSLINARERLGDYCRGGQHEALTAQEPLAVLLSDLVARGEEQEYEVPSMATEGQQAEAQQQVPEVIVHPPRPTPVAGYYYKKKMLFFCNKKICRDLFI
jgi:hypothetical protein